MTTADEFDRFLRDALSPPDREADRAFTTRVRAQLLLEERLRGERSASLRQFGWEILGILAVAAGFLWLVRSPELSEFVSESPAVAVAALLCAFVLLVAVMAAGGGGTPTPRGGDSRIRGLARLRS